MYVVNGQKQRDLAYDTNTQTHKHTSTQTCKHTPRLPTIMRRALPTQLCGTSPSPAISLLVSMMIVSMQKSVDSSRAISRMIVVFDLF